MGLKNIKHTLSLAKQQSDKMWAATDINPKKGPDILGGAIAAALAAVGLPWVATSLASAGPIGSGLSTALQASGATQGLGLGMTSLKAGINAANSGSIGDALLQSLTSNVERGAETVIKQQVEAKLRDILRKKVEESAKKYGAVPSGELDQYGQPSYKIPKKISRVVAMPDGYDKIIYTDGTEEIRRRKEDDTKVGVPKEKDYVDIAKRLTDSLTGTPKYNAAQALAVGKMWYSGKRAALQDDQVLVVTKDGKFLVATQEEYDNNRARGWRDVEDYGL
jgi:hypothetical protein